MEDRGPRDGKSNLVSTWSKPREGRWGEVLLMISKVKRYQEKGRRLRKRGTLRLRKDLCVHTQVTRPQGRSHQRTLDW